MFIAGRTEKVSAASAVWNTVSSQKISAVNPGTPIALANQIKFYTTYNKINGVVQAVPSGKFLFSRASVINELLEMNLNLALYVNKPSFIIVG